MDRLTFWKQKIIQAFHDPPAKPYAFFPGTGGHRELAEKLFEHFTREDFKFYARRPDLAASGADRPVVSRPRGKKGQYGAVQYHRDGNNIITHPLAADCVLRLSDSKNVEPLALEDIEELIEHQEEVLIKLSDAVTPGVESGAEQPTDESGPADWNDPDGLEKGFWILWRRFRDELGTAYPGERLLWERIPSDSRVPDHSIWEHLKVASALAFLNTGSAKPPEEKEPWLFSFAVTPVQSFIRESRTSRDLWVSSFLIADLVWHAMRPIVERYGPDAIVYPDLRANPRVDNWLYRTHRERLPDNIGYPVTYAAVLPNTFTAILPGGGRGHLLPITEIARDCAEGMQKRWRELESQVRTWLSRQTNRSGWEEIWKRQHESVFASYWTAVQWQVPPKIIESEFKRLTEGGALPAQDRAILPPPSEDARKQATRRASRLSVWMPGDVWAHYERARAVFGRVNLGYIQNERGFDYSLTHHELRMRQRLRKQEARHRLVDEEPGEKCTQCRTREALHDVMRPAGDIDSRRAQVRDFWKEVWDKRKEADRTDRLCGVCSFKRFLIEAGGKEGGINSVFRAPEEEIEEPDGIPRVPFPSTSAVAAQEFLAAAATSDHSAVRQAISRVVEAHRSAELRLTLFPQTLPRLLEASRKNPQAGSFLKIDPQESVFPESVQTLIDRAGESGDVRSQERLTRLRNAVDNFRRAAGEAKIRPPDSHIAVVRLDGDHMGRLLLGDSERVGAVWRDVIHPRVVARLEEIEEMKESGWASLLDSPRLMGPSLHAFISRALADFSHRIVPWVVEQEYGGRLIYAGGDDILALAPARDALPMAARLQQLFSAAWIIDGSSEERPWGWRSETSKGFDPEQARLRFMIPTRLESARAEKGKRLSAIELPLDRSRVEAPIGVEAHALPAGPLHGQVIAGLGLHQSLSASIVYGHFRTQLSLLLEEGRRLLDETAKEKVERGAVAMSHRSRSGSKSMTALHWSITNGPGNQLRADELVDRVVKALRDESLPRERRLPARLPYKLRAVAPLLLVETDLSWPKDLARGLLTQALDGVSLDKELMDAVLTLWERGYDLHVKRGQASYEQDADSRSRAAQRSVDGLLLCRYLAGQGSDGEQ
jgi:CRISPR-associated protein Cmr2